MPVKSKPARDLVMLSFQRLHGYASILALATAGNAGGWDGGKSSGRRAVPFFSMNLTQAGHALFIWGKVITATVDSLPGFS